MSANRSIESARIKYMRNSLANKCTQLPSPQYNALIPKTHSISFQTHCNCNVSTSIHDKYDILCAYEISANIIQQWIDHFLRTFQCLYSFSECTSNMHCVNWNSLVEHRVCLCHCSQCSNCNTFLICSCNHIFYMCLMCDSNKTIHI